MSDPICGTRHGGGAIIAGLPQDEAVFGRWLRRRRKFMELTQNALARLVGCSTATIRKIESDERRPSRSMALALAEALGVPADERPAFVRFARSGWADEPPAHPAPDLDQPWLPLTASPAPEGVPSSATAGLSQSADVAEIVVPTWRRRPLFAREAQLSFLAAALGEAVDGKGRIVLIAGEAGQGKTTLMTGFSARAQAAHRQLLVATGSCNAFTGDGDPFLPFRDVLRQLTGEVLAGPALDPAEAVRIARLRNFMARAATILLEDGTHLIDAFVPSRPLRERLRATAANLSTPMEAALRNVRPPWRTPSPQSQQALASEVSTVLARIAEEVPLVLLLDDLQWADNGSIDLLVHLARIVQSHAILVLGAYRPSAITSNVDGHAHPTQMLVHELGRQAGGEVLDLDRADGRAFIEGYLDSEANDLDADFRERLWQHTGGQPLFTIELMHAMQERGQVVKDAVGRWSAPPGLRWDTLPARVAGVLAERVQRLDATALRVLQVASVEGGRFTTEVVASVLETDPAQIAQVVGEILDRKHRLVAPLDVNRMGHGLVSRHRFRHDLTHLYVYKTLGESERTYLHEAVADALETVYGDEADPVALVHHLTMARARARAAVYHRQVGDRACRTGALDEAIASYREAASHWPASHRLGRAHVLRDLGACQFAKGLAGAAQDSLEESYAIFMDEGEPRSAGAVKVLMGRVSYDQRDYARGLATCREALEALDEDPESAELAMALSTLSFLHLITSEYDEALVHGQRALEVALRVGADEAHSLAMLSVGSVLASTDPDRRDEGLELLRDAHRVADATGLPSYACTALADRGARLLDLGRIEEGRAQLQHALTYARQRGVTLLDGWIARALWRLDWRCGDWAGALSQLPMISDLLTKREPSHSGDYLLRIAVAAANLDLGRTRLARDLLDEDDVDWRRLVEPQVRLPYLRERLRLAVALGRWQQAESYAAGMIDALGTRTSHSSEVIAPVLSASLWLAAHPSRAALDLARRCLLVLERTEGQYRSAEARAAAAEGRGVLAVAVGDASTGASQLLQAADHWQDARFPLDEARARSAAARAFRAGGQSDKASAEETRAASLLSELAGRLDDDGARSAFARVQRDMLAWRA